MNDSQPTDGPNLLAADSQGAGVSKAYVRDDQSDHSNESHFQIDHLRKNLGQRAVSSGFITAGAQAIKLGLNMGGIVVLARLLTPQDFGLVAMTTALMSVLRVLREGGLSTATIQREGITQAQVSNLFWINLALGGALTCIGVALSPVVAWFYRDARLIVVTALLSLSFAFGGTAVQHLALLNRQMRFRAIAAVDLGSTIVGFLVGTACAWFGLGYWSLVGMQLSTSVAEMALTWVASGWRPHLPRRLSGTKPLLHFGTSMAVYIFLRRIAGGADVILLGRFYGANIVGFYSRGQALLLRPLDQFIGPFDAVFVPLLSRLQLEPQRYREVFLRLYGIIALLSFSFAGLLFGLSQPVVLFLLGSKWAAVVPIFAWLSFAALFIPMNAVAMWPLTTQGRSRDLVIMGVITPLSTVASVAVGLPFGAVGVAMTFSMVGFLVRLPAQYYIVGRFGPVNTRDLYRVFFQHLPIWAAVAAATWLTRQAIASFPPIAQLALGGLVGGLVALAVVASLSSLRQEALLIINRVTRLVRKPA